MLASLEQLAETAKKAEAALSLQSFQGEVLAGLCRDEGLPSFAICVRELICVDGVHGSDGDVR